VLAVEGVNEGDAVRVKVACADAKAGGDGVQVESATGDCDCEIAVPSGSKRDALWQPQAITTIAKPQIRQNRLHMIHRYQ
jgi:hypothetical protein